ncbi:hypothetical protein [Methylobacterium nigriterrae]|uniref:hypothetical protein n=1 Tax=Methylobacterium nigriterrae TaxID=3127512 RepID=UPI00301338E5
MRILRLLAVGAVVVACTGIVGFTCADRLTHLQAAPAARIVRAPAPEPSATGSILPEAKVAEKAAAPKPAAPKIPNGFDTERLNALMRGDPIAPTKR